MITIDDFFSVDQSIVSNPDPSNAIDLATQIKTITHPDKKQFTQKDVHWILYYWQSFLAKDSNKNQQILMTQAYKFIDYLNDNKQSDICNLIHLIADEITRLQTWRAARNIEQATTENSAKNQPQAVTPAKKPEAQQLQKSADTTEKNRVSSKYKLYINKITVPTEEQRDATLTAYGLLRVSTQPKNIPKKITTGGFTDNTVVEELQPDGSIQKTTYQLLRL